MEFRGRRALGNRTPTDGKIRTKGQTDRAEG